MAVPKKKIALANQAAQISVESVPPWLCGLSNAASPSCPIAVVSAERTAAAR